MGKLPSALFGIIAEIQMRLTSPVRQVTVNQSTTAYCRSEGKRAMYITQMVIVSMWCLCGIASSGADVLNVIGHPTDLLELKKKWPSNSVYCAYTKETISIAHGNEGAVYKRYVVDKPGTNPSVLPGGTCDYVHPLLQYHVKSVGTNSAETVEAIEVYKYANEDSLFRSVCKDLGIEVLPFHEAVAIAPEQMWRESDHNYLNIVARTAKYGDMTVIYYYEETNLVSLTAFPKRGDKEGAGRETSKALLKQSGVVDLQDVRLGAINQLGLDVDRTEWEKVQKWSDVRQKKFLRFVESIKSRSEDGAPTYERMARTGLFFSEEIRIVKRPVSRSERVYSTAGKGVQVITMWAPLPIKYETTVALFIDQNILGGVSKVIFPYIGELPQSLHDCRKHMKIIKEINNFAGTRCVVFCDSGLTLLYDKEILRYAFLPYASSGENQFWKMLGISGELLDIQGGHQYVRWR